jgi:AcrR family transcriptional regulator
MQAVSNLERRMAERRERILETARSLIEDRGYEALTMRELARESGLTVPTIYNLIGNKESVLLAAVEEQTKPFVAGLAERSGDLIGVIEAAVRQLVRRPRYYRSLLLVLGGSGNAGPAHRYVVRALAEQIDRGLADLEASGELVGWALRPVLAERLRAHFEMASLEWARGRLTGPAFRAAAIFDAATSLLGMTTGAAHAHFEALARQHQSDVRRSPGSRISNGRAA